MSYVAKHTRRTSAPEGAGKRVELGRELHCNLLLSAFLIRAWLLSSPLLRVQSLVRQLDWDNIFKFGASLFPESTVHTFRASSVLQLTLRGEHSVPASTTRFTSENG